MKARSPFFALLKFEVLRCSMLGGVRGAWVVPVILLGINVAPALMLWREPQRSDLLVTLDLWALMMVCSSGVLAGIECPIALVRGVWRFMPRTVVPSHNADEFLYSRAIDRVLQFRAKTVLLALVLVLPLGFNLGLVCLVAGQFPPGTAGILNLASAAPLPVANAVVTAAFACAVLWASSAIVVLAQGYYGLVSRFVPRESKSLIALAVGLPIALIVLAAPWVMIHFELVSQSVQFFIAHWLLLTLTLLAVVLPVQRFCERRFAEQEVL